MSNPIEFNGVWKKFRKGEKFNSLRDAIPNLIKELSHLSNNQKMLTLEDKEFWAVKNVSFEVKRGEVLGIIGPNGAGKSTVLKLLSRIMDTTKGEVKIQGRLSALIEVTAGFHPELTGRENIYLNGTILGMKRKEIDARIDSIIDFSGVEEFVDTPVKKYSSGMYSRLGFSVAAHVNPEILLVDEVLAVGDIAFRSKCAQKMRELLKTGVTIVLVSHNLPLMQSLCKRCVLLNKGEVLKVGAPDDVIPYYEQIVYNQQEQEIKKKISSDGKLNVRAQSPITFSDVRIFNKNQEQSESYKTGDEITVRIGYSVKEQVENPIFVLELIRADGILCCTSSTKDNGYQVGAIGEEGTLELNLGKLPLAQGVFVLKLTIWDKDMIHAYDVRKQNVIRISGDGLRQNDIPIFIADAVWKKSKP